MQFLIRTNAEDEGWTTDGIFGPKEAFEKVASLLGTKQYVEHEGHHFEYVVYVLDEKNPAPKRTASWAPQGTDKQVFYAEGKKVLEVPLSPPLDY